MVTHGTWALEKRQSSDRCFSCRTYYDQASFRVRRSSEVSFRFYGQLNDFLPVIRRGRRFTHVLGALGSVKDTIEALGG
jgi:hypothetical protein